MSKVKAKTVVAPVVSSKRGQNRDPKGLMKLSLKLGFARAARINK